ncbi:SDR family NAD(P)-dependent oxidoreductase [Thauera mechernichensis]|uniref:SDR family NAD(P)-dependent oxidoreductase n=1 Tax=Thauera mechernichensis TaxID=82788 RepID=A0ABW3WC05_9RHOO|nr:MULTISPECIES: SDR family oxidoreductase [Thauera]HAY09152.1 SDR family NAD(P)-dependent oxidoreductase [Thauera sp.]ENO75678.1 oxidoreductase, short-chain dehydrogenase/reductase [Thauera sp. 27]ENO94026.1 oxidoreductase, short-chain dehydrogenase/reductase [Thauera sp. 28]MDG3066836.1 SDR family NAD(P)-dependent oxidoreductase [Thauera mechernichensis]WBL64586.1 SDR family oxidoreductase [Thauera sp. WB-2]
MSKVAFITGASRGIGRETALAFARAGYDLAISARTLEEGETHAHALTDAEGRPLAGSLASTAAAVRALGREVLVLRMDLLDEASVRGAAAAVLAHYGQVDVLVNNAIYQGSDLNLPFMALGGETLQRVFQGYVMAPVVLTQCLLPAMIARGGGTVINVTSGAGESDPPVAAGKGGWGYAYGAGKAAVSRLSGVLAAEFGEQGIRAFTINPGVVTTEALRATIGDKGVLAMRKGVAPPEVPAAVMCWLATQPEADRFQRRTVQAQAFALEHGVVPDWRNA